MDLSEILLITDFDDTLLNTNKEISKENINAINEFIALGGNFTIATGRVFDSALPYLNQLNLTAPCILYNGAIVYDPYKKEILWKKTLPETARKYTKQILNKFDFVAAEILVDEDVYVVKYNNVLNEKIDIENISPQCCNIDDIPDNWIKILFTIQEEFMDNVVSFISEQGYEDVYFVKSCEYYYEMLPKYASKGRAINIMKDIMDITELKTISVGDFDNDLEMIKMADVGMAVANASDTLKKHADVVLKSTCNQNVMVEVLNYIKQKLV